MDNYQNLVEIRYNSNAAMLLVQSCYMRTNYHYLENTYIMDSICLALPENELSFCLLSH